MQPLSLPLSNTVSNGKRKTAGQTFAIAQLFTRKNVFIAALTLRPAGNTSTTFFSPAFLPRYSTWISSGLLPGCCRNVLFESSIVSLFTDCATKTVPVDGFRGIIHCAAPTTMFIVSPHNVTRKIRSSRGPDSCPGICSNTKIFLFYAFIPVAGSIFGRSAGCS